MIAAAAARAHAPADGSAAGSSAALTTEGSMVEGVGENVWRIQCAVRFCQLVKLEIPTHGNRGTTAALSSPSGVLPK